ncbi:MAG: hypothetical protein AAF928_17655 [Myxococcota bacterium]
MTTVRVSIVVWLSAALVGCGSVPPKRLRFAGAPADALVTVEDRYIGKLERLEKKGVLLAPGEYRVTVEQTGYFPYDVIIVVPEEGKPEVVKVDLEPIPD